MNGASVVPRAARPPAAGRAARRRPASRASGPLVQLLAVLLLLTVAPVRSVLAQHGGGGGGDHGGSADGAPLGGEAPEPHGEGAGAEAHAYPDEVHHEPVGVGEILTSPSFIATLINFLIFAFLFVRLAGGPVGSFFSGRSESVARELEEARRLTAEANEKQAEYEERLRKIDDELADLRTQMIRSGEKERDRLVAEARDKAERMRRDAELAIEQRIRALRADLTRETVEAALQQATKLLEAKMTTEDQDRLAASYVDALGAQANKALGADGSARSSS